MSQKPIETTAVKAFGVDNAELAQRILSGDRTALSRGITLVESRKHLHWLQAQDLLERLLPHTGHSQRVGLSGAPGAGKSTTIDALGCYLCDQGHKVGVLTVDPSSTRTGGSILGDKTRMSRLANHPRAYIRPSPTSGTLGGVAAKTRETVLLCEAAGFDVLVVETVGTGQSEITIASMVDVFVVLMLPGAGDELQGLKKGILEIADIIAVNKADTGRENAAQAAVAEYQAALRIIAPPKALWTPKVLALSALEQKGIDALWREIKTHNETMRAVGLFSKKREHQRKAWLSELLSEKLIQVVKEHPDVCNTLEDVTKKVTSGQLPVGQAVELLLKRVGFVKDQVP